MGTPVTLTFLPDANFSFSGWGGDCSGNGACVVGMTSPRTVVATFGNAPASGACGGANGVSTATLPSGASLCTTGSAGSVNTSTGSPWYILELQRGQQRREYFVLGTGYRRRHLRNQEWWSSTVLDTDHQPVRYRQRQ